MKWSKRAGNLEVESGGASAAKQKLREGVVVATLVHGRAVGAKAAKGKKGKRM